MTLNLTYQVNVFRCESTVIRTYTDANCTVMLFSDIPLDSK